MALKTIENIFILLPSDTTVKTLMKKLYNRLTCNRFIRARFFLKEMDFLKINSAIAYMLTYKEHNPSKLDTKFTSFH